MRPSDATAARKPSIVVSNLLVSRMRSKCWSKGWSVLAKSVSRLSASVVYPVLIFFVFGKPSSSKRTTWSCLGEPTLNSCPASLWAPAVSCATSSAKNWACAASFASSTAIPNISIFANSSVTGISSLIRRSCISRFWSSSSSTSTKRYKVCAWLASNEAKSSSSCSAFICPRKRSAKSDSSIFLAPGLTRYAASSVSKTIPAMSSE